MSACLFCQHAKSLPSDYPAFMFNEKRFEYRECSNCKLVYISPLLDNSDLAKLYSLEYHEEFYFVPKYTYEKQEALLRKYKSSGRMLDYGCGDGSFLNFFAQKNYALFGAEYNPKLVEKLNNYHQQIHFLTIDSILADNSTTYDVIHMGDVLEHLTNPAEIVQMLSKRLSPGGVLFIEGPIEHNTHFAYFFRAAYFKLRKLLQPGRIVTMRPFHIFFSNRKNQKDFFTHCGFETLHYEVFEWAWPFPGKWSEAKSIKQKGEFFIGKISIALSKRLGTWGNRFYYIGTPGKNSTP